LRSYRLIHSLKTPYINSALCPDWLDYPVSGKAADAAEGR